MKHIRIPFLVVALSLTLTGMAFAIDIPVITTWLSNGNGVNTFQGWPAGAPIPGTTITGVGGGGPGRGDVLLGPLYDCRDLTDPNLPAPAGATANSQQTLIALVNTDHNFGVVGRLRFREWKRSVEVLDFDLCMTSNDVWVAQVSRLVTGGCVLTAPPDNKYVTNIAGTLVDTFTCNDIPSGGFAFKTSLITDGDPNPLARTEYGEFEFIGEEKYTTITAAATIRTITRMAVPAVGGVCPAGYPYLVGTVCVGNRDVDNKLEGTAFLIRPVVAISHQYNLTALANFAVDVRGIYRSPATAGPNLLGEVQGGPDPLAPGNPGMGGFDNLEALMSKRFLDFQYVDEGLIGSFDPTDTTNTPMSTSLVITFPTKTFHYWHPPVVPGGTVFGNVSTYLPGPAYPYWAPFSGNRETLGDETRATAIYAALAGQDVGEVVNCSIWDRFEHLLSPPSVPISPTVSPTCRIPWQVNVIGLYPTETVTPPIFRNNWVIPTASVASGQTFYSGWGRVDLSPPLGIGGDTRAVRQGRGEAVAVLGTEGVGVTRPTPIVFNFFNNFMTSYLGLPAIGIVMTEFYNGSISGYYGNTVPWQYGVDWDCTTCVPPIGNNPPDPPNPN